MNEQTSARRELEVIIMEKFKSTETLMAMLESGDYKRPLMQNDETAFDPEERRQNAVEPQFAKIEPRTPSKAEEEYLQRLSAVQKESDETVFGSNVRF